MVLSSHACWYAVGLFIANSVLDVYFFDSSMIASLVHFEIPFYIIFNLAIGGNMGGTVDDAIFNEKRIMYIDWVRVYQREEIE